MMRNQDKIPASEKQEVLTRTCCAETQVNISVCCEKGRVVTSKTGEMGEKLLERFATHLIEFPDSPRTGKAQAQK